MPLAILIYEHILPLTQIILRHTAYEHSAACLSVVFELLPGFIPFVTL